MRRIGSYSGCLCTITFSPRWRVSTNVRILLSRFRVLTCPLSSGLRILIKAIASNLMVLLVCQSILTASSRMSHRCRTSSKIRKLIRLQDRPPMNQSRLSRVRFQIRILTGKLQQTHPMPIRTETETICRKQIVRAKHKAKVKHRVSRNSNSNK